MSPVRLALGADDESGNGGRPLESVAESNGKGSEAMSAFGPVAGAAGPSPDGLRARAFSTIRAERARWLWDGRIPLGAVTLLVGREKLGKSTLTCELAARLSRGELAGDLHGKPSAALLVSFEDSAARTVKPRLLAAGADVEQVHQVIATRDGADDLLSLPADSEQLGELARDTAARVLVIDPFSASLTSDVDGHRDQHVRRALAPLTAVAEREDLAVILVAHWNKAQGGDPLSRVLGSRGLTAAVRSVLAFGIESEAQDGSPDRVLAHAACTMAREAASLSCRIESRRVQDADQLLDTSRLVLGEETDTSASDLLRVRQDDDREPSALEEATSFLLAELSDGPQPAKQVQARARDCSISSATLNRARGKLEVKATKDGYQGAWIWSLQRCSSEDEHLCETEDEHLCESPVFTGDSQDRSPKGAHTRETGPLWRNEPHCTCANGDVTDRDELGRCGECFGWPAR